MELHCCYPDCPKEAEFEIQEDNSGIHPADGCTHACAAHVGEFLGSVDASKPTTIWIVSSLQPQNERAAA